MQCPYLFSYNGATCVSRLGCSVPNYSWHCKTKSNNSMKQFDIKVFFSGQVYFKTLEVPFAKLAFKTFLPNVITFLKFAHSSIFPLRLNFYVNKKVPFS